MKKDWLNVPNMLSMSRLLTTPLLYIFILQDWLMAFLIGFIIIGLTDALDGYFARLLNQVTTLGKILDTVADMFFYLSIAWFFYRLFPQYLEPNLLLLIGFFIVYLTSFLVSFLRCGKPMMLHTSLLRFNAVLVYFLVIMSFLFNTTLFVSAVLIVFIFGLLETIWIFIRFGHVDVDTKSIFHLIAKKRRAEFEALLEKARQAAMEHVKSDSKI